MRGLDGRPVDLVNPRFPNFKNFRLVQAKRNVLKKVVSHADESPTFDEDFLDTKLELKKKH